MAAERSSPIHPHHLRATQKTGDPALDELRATCPPHAFPDLVPHRLERNRLSVLHEPRAVRVVMVAQLRLRRAGGRRRTARSHNPRLACRPAVSAADRPLRSPPPREGGRTPSWSGKRSRTAATARSTRAGGGEACRYRLTSSSASRRSINRLNAAASRAAGTGSRTLHRPRSCKPRSRNARTSDARITCPGHHREHPVEHLRRRTGGPTGEREQQAEQQAHGPAVRTPARS